MSGILTNITALVTAAITWVGDFVECIVKPTTTGSSAAAGNELLLLFVVTAFVGLGVGLIRRIIKL